MELDFADMSLESVQKKLSQKFNCAQITFAHGAYFFGLDLDIALKIPAVFGGGMHHGNECGAVTGALMAIGLKYGSNQPDEADKVAIALAKQAEFEEKFKAMYQSILCRELLNGLDFGKPDDIPKIVKSGLLSNLCPQLIASACDILDKILTDD